jgi:hypothetical protein
VVEGAEWAPSIKRRTPEILDHRGEFVLNHFISSSSGLANFLDIQFFYAPTGHWAVDLGDLRISS